MNKVLIVDASDSDRRLMSGLLVKHGYEPIAVDSMEAAKDEVEQLPPGAVIVADYKLPDGSAKELVNWLKSGKHYIPVIAIVNNRTCPEATDVMEDHGAVAVIQRPAIDKELVDYVSRYVKDIDSATPLDEKLIDRPSDEFKKVKDKIARLATSNANIIIFGESGMGKEQIAREIYRRSSRIDKSLIVIEAGSVALVGKHNPTSTDSEMYGRISSYFTNAAGGTIIIKNIHLLDFDKQSVLLHILVTDHSDVRVICTAEPELLDMVADKSFRSNLFFNLREMDVTVLPLRKSGDDIQPVAEYYLQMFAEQYRTPVKRLDASAVKALRLHDWPGNIRELRNVIRHAVINASGDLITANDISISRSSPMTSDSRKLNDPTAEKQKIIEALAQTDGNITQAAKLLGIGRTTLDYKMRNHGLKKSGV